MKVDVLVDVQRGDCGKGKISKALNDKKQYDIIAKFNGGGNAGHAVWIGDEKYTAHYLTSGIYYPNTKIIIGPGCVLNPTEFLNEYNKFNEKFDLDERVFIHPYTHIITQEHIDEEIKESRIGTTRKGIGPAYSSKYARTNIRAENVEELKRFLLPTPNVMQLNPKNILMEGSQGWWLDIDHGSYPYVTSSHMHPGFAFTTYAIPLKYVNKVYGVAKIYETYVGVAKDLVVCTEEDAHIIREAGQEYGETTGRPREIGYLNIIDLANACNSTGVDVLYINKCDILEEVGIFKVLMNNVVLPFENFKNMKTFVKSFIKNNTNVKKVNFSFTRDGSDIK
jgi:adenylosuccinate synthase